MTQASMGTAMTGVGPADRTMAATGLWQTVPACPSCGNAEGERARLFNQLFYLHTVRATSPRRAVNLVRCGGCGLVYKDIVPSPKLLSELTGQVQTGVWQSSYDYAPELAEVRRLVGDGPVDVLDIGAASGEFLRAMPPGGRKSALDILQFDGLKVTGEFITGFLDTPSLAWRGKPYRIVTAFDVLEHLYDPPVALANLAEFVADNGFIVVETGDSDRVPTDDLTRWYYLNGIDHHIAWNARSFGIAAEAAGLEVVEFVQKPHKLDHEIPGGAKPAIKALAFDVAPGLYRSAYKALGKPLSIPRQRGRIDHFRAVLKRVRSRTTTA